MEVEKESSVSVLVESISVEKVSVYVGVVTETFGEAMKVTVAA